MIVFVMTCCIDGEPHEDVVGVYASEECAERIARDKLQKLGVDNPNCRAVQGGKLINCDGITQYGIYAFRVEE